MFFCLTEAAKGTLTKPLRAEAIMNRYHSTSTQAQAQTVPGVSASRLLYRIRQHGRPSINHDGS